MEITYFSLDKRLLLWLLWSILWLMDLAEWTLYDWLLQLFDYRCPITVNCPITLSDYNCTEWLVKNEAADAPITFEEIVMVMIRHQNMVWASATHSALLCMLFCSHHLVTLSLIYYWTNAWQYGVFLLILFQICK